MSAITTTWGCFRLDARGSALAQSTVPLNSRRRRTANPRTSIAACSVEKPESSSVISSILAARPLTAKDEEPSAAVSGQRSERADVSTRRYSGVIV